MVKLSDVFIIPPKNRCLSFIIITLLKISWKLEKKFIWNEMQKRHLRSLDRQCQSFVELRMFLFRKASFGMPMERNFFFHQSRSMLFLVSVFLFAIQKFFQGMENLLDVSFFFFFWKERSIRQNQQSRNCCRKTNGPLSYDESLPERNLRAFFQPDAKQFLHSVSRSLIRLNVKTIWIRTHQKNSCQIVNERQNTSLFFNILNT